MRAKTGKEREEIIVEQLNQGKVEKTGTHKNLRMTLKREGNLIYKKLGKN